MPELLTAREVRALTGATLRQLQYWHDSRFTKSVVRVHGGHVRVVYDGTEVRRARMIMLLARKGGRWIAPLKRLEDGVLAMRYLLFSPRLKLIAATDDRVEAIRLMTSYRGGVLLVELPELPPCP